MLYRINYNPIKIIRSILPSRSEHYLILSPFFLELSKSVFPNSSIGAYIFLLFSVVAFFVSLFICFKRNPLKGAVRNLYTFLILWTVILTFMTLLAGNQGNTISFSTVFASNAFMPHLIPLIVMCYGHSKRYDFKYLFNFLSFLGIIYLIYSPFAIPRIISLGSVLQNYGLNGNSEFYSSMIKESVAIISFFPGFLCLFCKKYLNKKSTFLFGVVCFIQLFIVMYMARRGATLQMLLNFICLWYIYNRSNNFFAIIKIIAIISILYIVWSNYDGSMFSILQERQNVNSRDGLLDSFVKDMTVLDWLFGRGWFGEYYDSSFMNGNRSSIEIGFLYLILKGGILYLIPYALLLMISAWNGFKKSNNILCKAFAAICLARVVSLIPFGIPYFTIQEFIVWMGVYMCNTLCNLKLSDEDVCKKILNNNYGK